MREPRHNETDNFQNGKDTTELARETRWQMARTATMGVRALRGYVFESTVWRPSWALGEKERERTLHPAKFLNRIIVPGQSIDIYGVSISDRVHEFGPLVIPRRRRVETINVNLLSGGIAGKSNPDGRTEIDSFSLSKNGDARWYGMRCQLPQDELAIAGLVAATVKSCYSEDTGLAKLEVLYGNWRELLPESTILPTEGHGFWSVITDSSFGMQRASLKE